MECFFTLIALLGLFFIATGVLYYRRPDIQWRVQQWYLQLWGSIRAEQGENWGCWSRIGVLVIIGAGLYMLWLAAFGHSEVQRVDATLSAAYTAAASPHPARATDSRERRAVATLGAIFTPLMPTLQ